ncbi:MAG: myxococcus cysteine-rich repeat containing protein, partial [Candidatus Burarchaeum sp.]
MSFSGKSSLFVIVILAFALLGFLAELVYAVPDNGPAPCILQVTGTDAEIMTSPASNVTVTLLGAEYTGTVDAYIDVGAGTQLLWLNAATQIGENYTTHVNDGTAVRLRGTGNPGLTVWSDEAGIQVEVLRNGDTLPTYAPYLSQASFGTILGPYLVNGTVVLAPNQAIVIWELGGTDVNSPAFDFQDLVLLVTLDCDTFCGDDYVQTPNDYGQTEECDGGDFCSNECTLIEVEGCTYSQGYWKNHPGAWPPVEGEYGWFNVTTMQTPPAGNAWYILAHQYIAAVLNRESGATVPNSVATAIAQSKVLLGSDVYEIGPGHLNRTQATDLADILDDYNNGLAGVPHCGEQQPEPQNMTIIATKIVCSNEADLPNWGKGGPDVTATTAADFLAQHPNCWLAPDWLFQWGNQNAANPGDNTGAAGGAWNSFGPTDANGIATVIMNNLSGVSEIHVREAFQQGYINFTYNMYGNNEHNVSAEIYCDKDVLNYDNYDFIRNPALNHTYYCVAWNVQERVCEPEEELVMNGAFEVPVVTHNAKWDIYADGTPGLEWRVEWQTNITSYSGNDRPEVANLELHRGVNSWLPANGMQHAELDTDWTGPNGALNGEPASVRIYEDIDTIPGETYRVRLAFSPRPGTGSADNVLEVKAGGAVLDTISAAGAGNTVWTYYEYDFIAASATTRLQLTDLGTPNSLGTFVDDVSMKCIEPQEPEPYCGDGEVNQESEECDDGNEVNGDGCSTRCTLEDVTIIAHKIVCDNEEDLPNWGAGPDVTITSETAADWVEEHEGCSLVEGWKFQWGINYPELQFPAGNSGEAGEPWTTITTGEGGYASATVELGDVSNIALREVPQEGYIPFSLNSEDDFSA